MAAFPTAYYVLRLATKSSGDPRQKLPYACCLSRLAAVSKVLGRGPWHLRSFPFLLEMIGIELMYAKHLAYYYELWTLHLALYKD